MFEDDPAAIKHMAELIAMQAKMDVETQRGGGGSASSGPGDATQVRGKRKGAPGA